jgi:hypothetical protein
MECSKMRMEKSKSLMIQLQLKQSLEFIFELWTKLFTIQSPTIMRVMWCRTLMIQELIPTWLNRSSAGFACSTSIKAKT